MINLKDYPSLDDANEQLRQISRIRKDDISQINNLQNIFISGRKVGKIPSSSVDVLPTDKIGDFNYDASYIYLLVDNAGTAAWRRATLGVW